MFLHLSVILSMGGGCLPHTLRQTPPKQIPPWQTPPCTDTLPLGRHLPWADTSLGGHPPGQTPPCTVHAGIWSTSRWYASYWNAFLLEFFLHYRTNSINLLSQYFNYQRYIFSLHSCSVGLVVVSQNIQHFMKIGEGQNIILPILDVFVNILVFFCFWYVYKLH